MSTLAGDYLTDAFPSGNDAVLISGDIYDRAIPPADAVALLSDTLRRLCRDLGVTVVVMRWPPRWPPAQ